jgi:hypothetical protein
LTTTDEESLGVLVGQRAPLGTNAICEESEDVSVDGVGLCEDTDGLGEVADVARVDGKSREPAAVIVARAWRSRPPVASMSRSLGAGSWRNRSTRSLMPCSVLGTDHDSLVGRSATSSVAFETSIPMNSSWDTGAPSC